jgi:hypothetical protein
MVSMNWLGPHGNAKLSVRRGEVMNCKSTSGATIGRSSPVTVGTKETAQ